MELLRCGLAVVFAVGAASCGIGAPQRASDIQNVNAISDDIAATRMTESPSRIPNPNASAGSVSVYSPSKDFNPGFQRP
jgi:hypothetical protein